MPRCYAMKFLRVAALPAILIVIGLPAYVSAPAQAKPSTAPAAPTSAPAVPLQTYTLPDKSASAGVPAGWQIKGSGSGMIVMTGPQGENITLGQIIVAHNGPFQAGQKGPNGAMITLPSSTGPSPTLSKKSIVVVVMVVTLSPSTAGLGPRLNCTFAARFASWKCRTPASPAGMGLPLVLVINASLI